MVPRRIALIAYWTAAFVGTHIPAEDLPLELEPGFDKIIHFFIFAPLAFLFCRAWTRAGTREQLWTLAALMVYAAFDELSQPPFNRTADPLDWVLDVAGAAAGILIFHFIQKRRGPSAF